MRFLELGLAIPLLAGAVHGACVKRTVTVTVGSATTSSSSSAVKASSSKSSVATSAAAAAPTTATSTLTVKTSASTSTHVAASTTTAATATIAATAATSGTGTATLSSSWYWIRAVESPYSHSYLQSTPTATPGVAVLSSPSSAGQFNIISGQLVYNTGTGTNLYMNVEDPTDKTQRKLQTWFNATENTYGTFSFSGDTVYWNVSDISRQNLGAWLVCENDQLFINTGAYGYQTPSGCYDETIHSYGGSVANV